MEPSLKIPKNKPRNGLLYLLVIALLVTSAVIIFNPESNGIKKISLNTFVEQVKNEEVKSVQVKNERLDIVLYDNSQEYAFKERGETLNEILTNVPEDIKSKIDIEVVSTEGEEWWMSLLLNLVPFLLIIGFFVFMMRQAQNTNNQALSFGKSRARLSDKERNKTTFKDVAGAEEAKEELIEIVDFLKNPGKYTQMGAKIPKGVLLVGAPGTGKTLLARAVSGEANVPFFNISGSEFVEMFVGVGASRVRDLFRKAKRNAPCIVFIDEIDAVGRHRGAGLGGGHDEREQTLNQILTEMDGFEKDTNVIVMAATNRPDVLDPALLRPGRFDRRVVVDMPDIKAREEILKVHAKGKPIIKSADLELIARHTPGFSGADLENLMNEAAILAARNNKKIVTMKDLQEAIEKVAMGPQRKSMVITKQEKEIVAYHEIGHALVGHILPYCDPIHKVTIISRGHALGVTWSLPEEDRRLNSQKKLEDKMAMALGGYAAEQVIFGEMTDGAGSDLQAATNIARYMVTQAGMSKLGPVIYGDQNREVFLGRDFGHVRNYSEEMASKIDTEIKNFVDKAYSRAKEIIEKYRSIMDTIVKDLIKKETLNADEFAEYFKGIKVPKKISYTQKI
ncbi:ATP-dependent zinc metalloprotease FtsH [Candidatus Peregrinibacteria bacterium]|nr:ATP-dependent zinc metalloprotease FtsH [Candidatus Peregrinibacteria bacterium]